MTRTMWLVFLFCLPINSVLCAEPIPDGVTLLTNILESRQSIQRGHVEVETVYNNNVRKDEPVLRKKWNICFDGDSKRRYDVIQGGNTEVVCLDCYAERTEFYYTTRTPTDPNSTMALAFYDGYDGTSDWSVPNPRWFGCLPDSIENGEFYLSPLEIYGTSSDKPEEHPKVISDLYGSFACWKVDWKFVFRLNGMSKSIPCSVWVDKLNTSHILRVEGRFEAEGIQYIDGVDSESEKYQNKIWFPKKLAYRRTENGKITASQDTLINVISLNEPLPPDTFSPKGISFLKPGTPVEWAMERDRPAERVALVWDGNNVVARGTFEMDKVMKESERFMPLSMFLILSGIALILFGIGMKLWKRYGT